MAIFLTLTRKKMNDKQAKEALVLAVASLKDSGVIRRDVQIADALGYSKPTVSAYLKPENGVLPSAAFVKKFEEVYGVKLARFIGETSLGSIREPGDFLASKMVRIQALSETILSTMAELIARESGRPVTSVLTDLEKSV